MRAERLRMVLSVVENILSVIDALSVLGFYDPLCSIVDFVDEDVDLTSDLEEEEDRCSHAGDSCTIDVTEDDLLQLAAETQQDDGEREDLIEGLRTLKFNAQDEVVICLRSRFIDINTKKEELNESDDDILDESDAPVSPKEDELDLLPPEKYKTCPPSSFEAALKNRSGLPKGSDSDLERTQSESTYVQEQTAPSTTVPKKSRSLPDIVDEKKTRTLVKGKKGFEKTSSQVNLSSKPKAPWIPGGKHIVPKAKLKPAKFFSTLKPTSESPPKGLRQKVLTRAAEINKKSTDDDKNTKYVRKPRSMSKHIEEKAKVFTNASKYGVVYNRTNPVPSSPEKRPPWRYGKSKAPAVPLPTIKPFIMRKAARKHELGLNRSQLKNLQSDLSKVLDHSHHQSCPGVPGRFNSLASSPLGRIPSTASRVAAQTYASSNKPQTEYQGCEVCRLKEAMRNSPVSHRLKSAPHRCSSQPSLMTITPSAKPKAAVEPEIQSASPEPPIQDEDVTVTDDLEKPKEIFYLPKPPFYSLVVPVTVFSLYFMLLFFSLTVFFRFSAIVCLLYHVALGFAIRFFYHCFNADPRNTVFLSKLYRRLARYPTVVIPLEIYPEGKQLWRYLSRIYWKDALSFVISFLPKTYSSFNSIFKLLFQDGRHLVVFLYQNYLNFATTFRDHIFRLPLLKRILTICLLTAVIFFLLYFFPQSILVTFLLAPLGHLFFTTKSSG